MMTPSRLRQLRDHRGATLIFVAIAMVMLLGFAAIAVDVGYLYVVRGELQNAADSGALAGAQVVYDDPTTTTDVPGTQVYAGANTVALDFVRAHYSENATVTLAKSYRDASGNLLTCNQLGDGSCIERGHWSFATHTFTPNASLVPVDLWNVTTEELDANTDFINAVRVITTRKRDANAKLPEHFFAYIFGAPRSDVNAVAVGYIGFAGTITPLEVDWPVAICKQAITDPVTGAYTCNVGRLINSGSGSTHQTGGWTDYSQPSVCTGAASSNDIKPYAQCGVKNPSSIGFGKEMNTTGGQVDTLYQTVLACWAHFTGNGQYDYVTPPPPTQPVMMRSIVIDCPSPNVTGCSIPIGTVDVNVLWVTRQDAPMNNVPRKMGDWNGEPYSNGTSCTGTGAQCWDAFTHHFNLKYLNPAGVEGYAAYEDKTIYFKPDCTPHIPAAITGGENFGILAKTPVLVK